MRNWVAIQLHADGFRPVIVIDPDGIASHDEMASALGNVAVHEVHDWFELRKAWEQHGRHSDPRGPRVVIVTQDPSVGSATDLPFDIEQASEVRRIRSPGSREVRNALLEIEGATSDIAVERLKSASLDPVDAVLTAVAGLPSIRLRGSSASEFQVALRLAGRAQPRAVIDLAVKCFKDPLALALLDDPPRVDEVQRAWEDWVDEPVESEWASHMQECRAELIDLFMAGRLTPVVKRGAELPLWATVGVAQESPDARAATLLADPPEDDLSLEDWVRRARWWGEVRSCLAQVNPTDVDLEARAWEWWTEADQRFLAWLRSSYGSQLTRAWANWPSSLDKVQPFLTKRRAASGRTLLVILDGMGFAQWTRIRELSSSLRVVRSGGVLAMLPTLTEVSRQAIAAGGPPILFSDSLRSTSREPQRWASAWSESDASSAWVRIDGARVGELSAIPWGQVDVIGLVLSATDELMHSAELLGDIGLHAGLEAWVRSGVLAEVIEQATAHGYEIWLTADHGNLAVVPAREPREGAFVERAGTRVRRYGSRALRNDGAVEGVVWDELPGYPSDESERLLFAPARTGWGSSRLSHGGLSLDEVIVPLVQIEAQR